MCHVDLVLHMIFFLSRRDRGYAQNLGGTEPCKSSMPHSQWRWVFLALLNIVAKSRYGIRNCTLLYTTVLSTCVMWQGREILGNSVLSYRCHLNSWIILMPQLACGIKAISFKVLYFYSTNPDLLWCSFYSARRLTWAICIDSLIYGPGRLGSL